MAELNISDVEKEKFSSKASNSDSSSSSSDDSSDPELERILNMHLDNKDEEKENNNINNKGSKNPKKNEEEEEEKKDEEEDKKKEKKEEKKEKEEKDDGEEKEKDDEEDKKSIIKKDKKKDKNKMKNKKKMKSENIDKKTSKNDKKKQDEDDEVKNSEKKNEKKSSNKKESNKIQEIKLNTKKEEKSSKRKSNKAESRKSLQNQDNVETGLKNSDNLIIEKNSSSYYKKEPNNKFYIKRYKKRLETLMNCLSSSCSSSQGEEKEIIVNKDEIRMKKENEIIMKEKEEREKFQKIDDIHFQIKGEDKSINELMKNDEINLQNEKIKYLEEKNMRLDHLNQMYYDIIKSTNLDFLRNNYNNNNNDNLKLQSLDNFNNNIPNFLTKNPDNLDFMIQNYIDGERNKNIHNFSDSMIDINQKITNYLIDNCLKEKEKNKYIEEFRAEIGQKLDKIEKVQKMQKHDIDFIIKYGLNKNKAIDPIIDLLNVKKPLPKLLRDEEEDKYEKVINKKNIDSYKNFYLHGRYTNNKNEKIISKSGVLKRTGSYIFENRNNYILKESEGYSKQNPILKKPFFENKEKNKKKNNNDEKDEDEEFEKFVAYKGRFFIPKDFKFGHFKEDRNPLKKPKKNNKIIDFII